MSKTLREPLIVEIIPALFLLLPFQQLRPMVQTLRVAPQAGGLRTFLKVCGLCVLGFRLLILPAIENHMSRDTKGNDFLWCFW